MSEQVSHVEFVWSSAHLAWKSGQLQDMCPRIENTYMTAVEALAETSFEVTGDKTVHVMRVPAGRGSVGQAHSYKAFSLFFDRQQIANSRYDFGFMQNVGTIAHELTHQERMKHVPFDFSPEERLVTEGLAMVAESNVRELLGEHTLSEIGSTISKGSNYWQWKLCEYLTDALDEKERGVGEDPKNTERIVFNKWFVNGFEGYGLGTWVVLLSYLEDEDFGKLLQTPTHKILDVL